MISLFLAEDHTLFAEGLVALLQSNDRFKVVGRAVNGKRALEEIRQLKPQVSLLDINMPEMDGILLSQALLVENPEIRIIILSTYSNSEFVRNLKAIGIRGYVLKSSGIEVLQHAIETVHSGGHWYEPEIEKALVEQGVPETDSDRFGSLSRRELEVLRLIGQGLTGNQMAEKLFLSTHTIETHRKNIQTKLGIRSTGSLIKYANERGLC